MVTHVVFSTKDRFPFITKSHRGDLHAYLAGAARNLGCECYRVGGTEDYVHLAIRLKSTLSMSKFIEEIKVESSKWAKTGPMRQRKFAWQSGYGAFSVSPPYLDKLIAYIDNQEVHHQKVTFQEEYRRFLKKYRIPYDEQYVWD